MMGRSELLAKMEQEAAAWDSGSGDIAARLRAAKADIEHLAAAAASHFQQAMLNGEKSNAYRHTLEAIARLATDQLGPAPERAAFAAWFAKRWPEFKHPTTSAFECWQAGAAWRRETDATLDVTN